MFAVPTKLSCWLERHEKSPRRIAAAFRPAKDPRRHTASKMRDGADFCGNRGIEATQAENAVSQSPPRQGLGHRLGKRVTMSGLGHQSAVDEDEFH